MKKFITDTLMNSGSNRYSQKRVMTFASFIVAIIYAFSPLLIPTFEVREFVFLGFLGAGGFSLYRTQKTNENLQTNKDGITE